MSATHRIVGPNVIERRVEMERAWHRAFENYFKPLGVEVRWTNYTVRPATNLGEQLQLLQPVMLHSVQGGQQTCSHPRHPWRQQAPAVPTLQHTVVCRSGGDIPACQHASRGRAGADVPEKGGGGAHQPDNGHRVQSDGVPAAAGQCGGVRPHEPLHCLVIGIETAQCAGLPLSLQAHMLPLSSCRSSRGTIFSRPPVQYNFLSSASLVVLSERAISPSFVESQGEYGGASTIIEV